MIRSLPTALYLILISFFSACSDGDSGASSGNARTALIGSTDVMVTGQLAIEDNPDLVINQKVEVQDGQGEILGTGLSDAEGEFAVSLPGQLVIGGTGLVASKELTLFSTTVDDESGKVLGVKQSLDLGDAVASSLKLGKLPMQEVAAIRGQIIFIDQDGEENTKTARIGTEVYIPGLSIYGRTDKDGKFLLLYVPEGDYTLRIEKGVYVKEMAVAVQAGKTLNLSTIQLQTDTIAPSTTALVDSTDFKNPLCLKLSSDEAGASIYYTLDGSTPTATTPFLYKEQATTCGADCPICITGKTTTLKYFAVDKSGNAENQQTKLYFYNPRWSDPTDKSAPVSTMSISGATISSSPVYLTSSPTITLSSNEGSDIYYTVDGTTPTTASTPYVAPFSVSNSVTLKYLVRDFAGNQESVKTYDLKLYNWSKITYTGTPPTDFNNLIYDVSRDQVVGVAADASCVGTDINTWTYTGTTWTQIASDAIASCGRAIVYQPVTHNYYLFAYGAGGSGSPMKAYKYDFVNNEWDFLADSANLANGVSRVIGVYDPGQSKILVSFMSGGSPNSYWLTFDTANDTFSGESTYAKPICDMVYDTGRNRVVAYGTCNAMGSAKGEVYEFASGSWSAVATENSGLGDFIAYDSFRGKVMTFGDGYANGSGVDETWEYNGTDWTQIFPATSPKKRKSCQITYDSTRRRLLILGGTDIFSNTLSDMWEYKY